MSSYYPGMGGPMPGPPGLAGMMGQAGPILGLAGHSVGRFFILIGMLTALIIIIVALVQLGKDTSKAGNWITLGVGVAIGVGCGFGAKKLFSKQSLSGDLGAATNMMSMAL